MPHPEAYNHFTNHPDWIRKKREVKTEKGEGIRFFENAASYVRENLL